MACLPTYGAQVLKGMAVVDFWARVPTGQDGLPGTELQILVSSRAVVRSRAAVRSTVIVRSRASVTHSL